MTQSKEDFVKLYVCLVQAVSEVLDQREATNVMERADEILQVLDNPLRGTIWDGKA